MSELTIFDFESQAVRSIVIDGEPWFIGKDICRCLDISNHRHALGRLDEDERKGVAINDPLGKNAQTMICVNEPGLYRLIFTSRASAAERFKRWLAHEVLPAIRKTGRYESAANHPSTSRQVRDSHIEEMLRQLSVVREYRYLYGAAQARKLVKRFPNLPQVDDDGSLIEAGDATDRFIAAHIRRAKGHDLAQRALWNRYVTWCEAGGDRALPLRKFISRMEQAGYVRTKSVDVGTLDQPHRVEYFVDLMLHGLADDEEGGET